jgi:hypothetical protein
MPGYRAQAQAAISALRRVAKPHKCKDFSRVR